MPCLCLLVPRISDRLPDICVDSGDRNSRPASHLEASSLSTESSPRPFPTPFLHAFSFIHADALFAFFLSSSYVKGDSVYLVIVFPSLPGNDVIFCLF